MGNEPVNKYLEFKVIEQKPKTKVIAVISKLHGYKLGIVKWYGPWRQYCFFPSAETVFNKNCLDDIILFMEKHI